MVDIGQGLGILAALMLVLAGGESRRSEELLEVGHGAWSS
jgi:hypothetical protein